MVGDSDTGRVPASEGPGATDAGGARYPELLERVPAIVYVADTGEFGRWRYVSPQIEQILGYTPAAWCADPGLWLDRLHPSDRDWVVAREVGLTGADPDGPALEYRMLHRGGRIVWIRDDAVLARGEDGELRWHGVLSDVTERKRVEAELERRAAQQAAVARLGEHALEGTSTVELMHEVARSAALMVGAEKSAVWELLPAEAALVLRAGLGWAESAFGMLRCPGGAGSQAG